MNKILLIQNTPSGCCLSIEPGTELCRIQDTRVFHGTVPVYEFLPHGNLLLTGAWTLRQFEPDLVAGTSRYVPSSARYGEDLQIHEYATGFKYLFRRLPAGDDHWVLLTTDGETVFTSRPPPPGTKGRWTLQVVSEPAPAAMEILACLIVYDRLRCGRL